MFPLLRLLLSAGPAGATVASPARPLKILIPRMGSHPGFEPELARVIEEFKRENPTWPLQVLRRGEGLSALRELMASYLASDLPDLSLIEEPELPALTPQELLRPLRSPESGASVRWFPFVKTLPVLVTHRALAGGARPATFAELLSAARGTVQPRRHALLIPLQGPKGLWIFESLSSAPLWERTPGGLRSRRENRATIVALQEALDTPGLLGQDETWEHALEGWVGGHGVWLVTSLESLPLLRERVSFEWDAQALPSLSGASPIATGNGWVALSDHPGIAPFLRKLYSPSHAARWIARGGLLPPTPTLQSSTAWQAEARKVPQYWALARQAGQWKLRSRSSDADLVRARSEWIQVLRKQLTSPQDRVPVDAAFMQLDTHLTRP